MRIVILAERGSWYGRDLLEAALKSGHQPVVVPFAGLAALIEDGHQRIWREDVPLDGIDAVLVRTMPPGSLEQVVFRMNLLAQLERQGVQVMNSAKSLECAVDKFLTTARLQEAGLPVPQTLACETAEAALAAFESLGGDVVVKPIFGSEGRGIVRVSDPDLAVRTFRTLERLQAVLYVQRFVEHGGRDVRVMVLDGRVLGGMQRCSETDFRTNISRQARSEPIDLTREQADWAVRAAAAVGARLAGVDLLYDEAGRGYVIEVNGVPGWKAFAQVSGVQVADEVIRSLSAGAAARR